MPELVSLKLDDELWEHVFVPSPLVLIGSIEPDGHCDFAPKHRVFSLPAHFGFVCRPSHATWRNTVATGAFTVSWPGPRQIAMTAAAASPRCEDGEKKALRALPKIPARRVEGMLVAGCRFYLECELDRVVDGFGDEGMLIGRIVAACADREALRGGETPDARLVHQQPLLTYLHPSQFALIEHSTGFPFPKGFDRT